MAGHRLRREIVTTAAGQRGGQPGRDLVPVPRARGDRRRPGRHAARLRRGARRLRPARPVARGRVAGRHVPTRGPDRAVYLEVRRLVDRAVRWLVTNRRSPIDVTAEIARLRPGVAELLPQPAAAVPRSGAGRAAGARDRPGRAGHAGGRWPSGRTRVMYGFGLLDIVEVARHDRPGRDRGGRRLLRPVGPVPGRRPAVADLRACPARTAGRPWPGWRCATTSTRRWPR